MQTLLHGFFVACCIFGLQRDVEIYAQVEAERGWKSDTSFGSLPYMKEAGLTEAEIVEETLTIEIIVLERMLAKHKIDTPDA